MAIDAALGRLGNKSGVCTSSTRPANPFEGQLVYETDTNRTLVYDNAAWLVVADNQVLSIDTGNSRVGINDTTPSYALDVTGDINATGDLRIGGTAIGASTAFTPSWNNLTPGSATENWHYARVNDVVVVAGVTVFAADTSVAGFVEMDLPVTSNGASGGIQHGIARFFDGSIFIIGGVQLTSTKAAFYPYTAGGTYVARGSGMNTTYPFTWATGDTLSVQFVYQLS